MAAPRTKVEISAVYKALKVNGETGTPAKKFLDLIFMIEQLGDKQQIIRARDLSDEHIGMLVENPKIPGVTNILNDIDDNMTVVSRSLAGGYRNRRVEAEIDGFDVDEVNDGLRIPRDQMITVVLDSKLVRLHRNALLILTELRDI
jgi:hypothetical protein